MHLDTAILFASIAGELLVCFLLLWRNFKSTLPFFTLYCLWALASDLASLIIQWKLSGFVFGRYYFYQSIADSLLQFTVLVELAWSVLKPVRTSLPRGSLVAISVLIGLAGIAIWPLTRSSMPPDLTLLSAILFQLQETFAVLRVACFLIMASFSQLLGIGWRDRELQIATGFGFYSIASLIVTILHSRQVWGPQYHWLDLAAGFSYVCSLAYWVFCFATKEQQRKEFSPQMAQFLVLISGSARSGRMTLGDIPPEVPRKRVK